MFIHQKEARDKIYLDCLYYKAYADPHISVQKRLEARDTIRRIREDTYEWPSRLDKSPSRPTT